MLATRQSRVLVADDQQDVVAAIRMLLRGAGLEVDPATSVQEVRHRLDTQNYDLVLMDLNYARDTTSGREGLDLLKEIHERDRLLPVIVMTGWGSIDTAVEAMRRGARTFVHKPWDNHSLTETVCREIEEGHALRESDKLAATEQADAQAIQRALLPAVLPAMSGVGLAAQWQPALAFGGDCYDALRVTETHLAISIADVCGKGLPAALLMSNLLASLRAFAASARAPRDVVTSVNRALCRQKDLRRFVTLFYALYDSTTRVTLLHQRRAQPSDRPAAQRIVRTPARRRNRDRNLRREHVRGEQSHALPWRSSRALHRRHHGSAVDQRR